MKRCLHVICAMTVLVVVAAGNVYANPGPFDGREFKGRIAFSSDGNYNDEDDWGAFPVAVALLDAFGVTDKLVHVDYCNILARNDTRFYREMTASVLGAAERFGVPRSVLFDCQKDLDAAIASITRAIDASSADDPLYYVLAGPMEVPFRGIVRSKPDKRKYVYCISHSAWNDGYTRSDRLLHAHNKRDVIPSGINWIQVKDGNRNLAHPGGVGKRSTPQQWRLHHWLRDSEDSRLRWIFSRLEAERRADISDSTMTYFLLTGDEDADLAKLERVLDGKQFPPPVDPRAEVRIEAENFLTLEHCEVEHSSDQRISHRLSVKLTGASGRIATPFCQPYTAPHARYNIDVRYFDRAGGGCRFALYVNGVQQGDAWRAGQDAGAWKTHRIPGVTVSHGDNIAIHVDADGGELGKLDYVQLHHARPA